MSVKVRGGDERIQEREKKGRRDTRSKEEKEVKEVKEGTKENRLAGRLAGKQLIT